MNLSATTFVELLRFRATSAPDHPIFTFLDDGTAASATTITYGELDRQARAIAALLQTNVTQGARALLAYPAGLNFISAFFGCLFAGVIAVPSYLPRRRRRDERLVAIAADAQPAIVLTDTVGLPTLLEQSRIVPQLADLRLFASDQVDWQKADGMERVDVNTDTLALLQYTSGSTGAPKGVMVTHGNLLHNQAMIATAFEHGEKLVIVSWLPLFHDMGLIGTMMQPLFANGCGVFLSPLAFLQRPARWLQAISHFRGTTCGAPNFAYELCARKVTNEQAADLDLSSWDIASSGAEPVRAATLSTFSQRFAPFGFRPEAFYPCYGMAEATLFISGGLKRELPIVHQVATPALDNNEIRSPGPDEQARSIVGCGRSWLAQELIIVDPDSVSVCPSRSVGEIWVRGPHVAQGYWRQPDATAVAFGATPAQPPEGFSAGPYLRTGDLGYLDGHELFVTGRLKDMIIVRGRNLNPQDIEQTAAGAHAALAEDGGAAFAIEDREVEKLVIVQEVARAHWRQTTLAPALREEIRRAVILEHEVNPFAIVLIRPGAIPKTTSGKIQRRACREAFQAGTLATWPWAAAACCPDSGKPSLRKLRPASCSIHCRRYLPYLEARIESPLEHSLNGATIAPLIVSGCMMRFFD